MEKFRKGHPFILIVLLTILYLVPTIASTGKVNINTAGVEQLTTLKGVGQKIAERIIEYRKKNPFKKPEEIMNVKGIGSKLFKTNKEMIVVKNE